MRKKIFETGMMTVRRIQDPYYQGTAAELGFYFIFSIVPILALILQIVSRFERVNALFARLIQAMGDSALTQSIVNSLVEVGAGKTSILFLVVALWSASKIEFSMIRMANYTYNVADPGPIGYFKARGKAIITTVFLIVLMIVSMMVLVFGNVIVELVDHFLVDEFRTHFDFLFSLFRWPLALMIYWLIIALNYRMLPNRRLTFKEIIPGSLFAAVGILVATLGYYIYLTAYSNLNIVYGSLATVIVMLLWFYWLGFILVVGMLINASWFGYGVEDD